MISPRGDGTPTGAGPHPADAAAEPLSADPRRALEQHVREVQRTIRSCAGCGLCCTQAYNSLEILPIEARRIAEHLRGLPPKRRAERVKRMKQTVSKYRLNDRGKLQYYTCAFLEPDLRCALPFDTKPVACLSFNPLTPDQCDQQKDWYHKAHAPVARANRSARLKTQFLPIPLAVLKALYPDGPSAGGKAARTDGRRGGRAAATAEPGASGVSGRRGEDARRRPPTRGRAAPRSPRR